MSRSSTDDNASPTTIEMQEATDDEEEQLLPSAEADGEVPWATPTRRRKAGSVMYTVAWSLGSALTAGALVAVAGRRPPVCRDPYLEPGYIRRVNGTNETTWHPYSKTNIINGGNETLDDPIPYSKLLASPNRASDDRLSFARDRTVLMIGESLDRDNLLSFCHQHPPGKVTWEFNPFSHECRMPDLNLTLINSMTTGMRGPDTPWFYPKERNPPLFEDRLALLTPFLPLTSLPSLIILSSHFWDLRFMEMREKQRLEALKAPVPEYHVSEADLEWHRGRVVEFVQLVRETFPDTPIMWRLGTTWQSDNASYYGDGNLGVFQLNESSRGLMRFLGIPIFNWATLLGGERDHRDPIHFHDGPPGNLFSSMVMYYLERAARRKQFCVE